MCSCFHGMDYQPPIFPAGASLSLHSEFFTRICFVYPSYTQDFHRKADRKFLSGCEFYIVPMDIAITEVEHHI